MKIIRIKSSTGTGQSSLDLEPITSSLRRNSVDVKQGVKERDYEYGHGYDTYTIWVQNTDIFK